MKHFLKCFLLVFFILANTSYSQIIYNKAKPLSYGNAALAPIDKIPVIDFLTDENNFIFKVEVEH